MPRAKIDLPETFPFVTEIPVRITDLNYGNHLGNDTLLSLVHEARVRFLKHYGYSEMDVEGTGIIMADAVVVYKAQAFYGDVLRFEVTAHDFSANACDLLYRVTHQESGREVARVKTRIVFYDYQAQRTVRVPEKFRQLFENG